MDKNEAAAPNDCIALQDGAPPDWNLMLSWCPQLKVSL
jgi:hypothetical protein